MTSPVVTAWESIVSHVAKTAILPDPSVSYDDIQQELWVWLLSDYGTACLAKAESMAHPAAYVKSILRNHLRDLMQAQAVPAGAPDYSSRYTYTAAVVRGALDVAFDSGGLTGIGVNHDDGVRVSGTHDPQAGQDILAVVVDVRKALHAADGWTYSTLADFAIRGLQGGASMRGIPAAQFGDDVKESCTRCAYYLNRGRFPALKERVTT